MALDLSINLLASIIFFILGYLTSFLFKSLTKRGYRKLFGKFYNNNCTILLSTRRGPNPESTDRVSYSEMEAFSELQKILSDIGITAISENSLKNISDIKTDNIFVLGGQFANSISADFWENIYASLPLKIEPSSRTIHIGTQQFTPVYDAVSSKMTTYSVIMRMNNPFKNNGYIFASIGMNGFGTYGGVKALCDKKSIKIINKVSGKINFIGIVESTFNDKRISSFKIINLYPLNKL